MKKLSSCKGIIAVILFSLILTCFAGCHLWYQDLKGYLEHWSDTVSVEGTEWSASPESQKNSSGVDTVATNATISASVAISNPENYALNYEIGTSSDPLKSVRLTGATAILSSARVISSSPSSIQVQIAPLSAVPTPESLALEHSDFTLQFIPVRSDSGLAAPTAESITLRYNTPPRMPLEVVYNKDSQQLDWMGSEGWKLVQQAHDSHLDNHIYWAWPRGITDPRHPDYVTKFQIYVDGSLSQEGAPDNFKYTDSTFISPKLADYQVYRVAGTSGSKIEIYAVDPEDVTSFATGSGIAPYKITLTTDQGFFSSSGVDSLEVYKAAGSLAIGSDFEAPYNSDTKYYLSGWTCDGNPVSFPLEISKDMELVAQWTFYPTDGGTGGTPSGDSEGTTGSGSASSSTYSITYDANGADSGTVPASQTKSAGKTVTLAKNSGNLTKEHHTFSGWNTQADGKGQFYGEGTTYATDANVTLYAQWTPNPSTGSDITGPGAVTGISSIKKNNFEPVITWTNPSDSDFDRTEITCSDGNISITINGNVATFMGIVSGKEYEVTFTTYDYTGNIGQTVTQKLTWNTIALDSLIGTGFTENGVDVSNPNATGSKLVLWFLSGETISLAEYIQYEPNVTAGATFTGWKNPATGGKVTSSDSIILDKAYTFYANYSVMSADYAVVYVEAALKGTSSCTHDITVVGSMTNDQLKELGSPLKDSNLPPVEINLDLSQTTGLTTIVKDAFRGAEGLTSIILPESIESIEEGAFYGCSFSSIEFPSSLKTLGKDAFRNCENLEQVIMPSSSSLSSIGEQAFMDCRKLSQITIPSSVTVIDEWAFYWCKSITSLTIPASVISIVRPFYECGSTLVLTMEASNPPNIEGGMEVKQIRVPKDSVEQYKAVDALSNVEGRIVGY